MTPRVASNFLHNYICLRPKPKNRPLVVLGYQPLKALTSSILQTLAHELDMCHCRPWPPGRQVFQRLHLTCPTIILTWITGSTLDVLLHLSVTLGAIHPRSESPGFSSPSIQGLAFALHRSQSIDTIVHTSIRANWFNSIVYIVLPDLLYVK